MPPGFPESAQFGDEFVQRVFASARTYKREVAKPSFPKATRDDSTPLSASVKY